jgi:hypothetical protein
MGEPVAVPRYAHWTVHRDCGRAVAVVKCGCCPGCRQWIGHCDCDGRWFGFDQTLAGPPVYPGVASG